MSGYEKSPDYGGGDGGGWITWAIVTVIVAGVIGIAAFAMWPR